MNKGVLYISYDGMTDNLGQSQVIPYMTGLQKRGFSIHILSCEKHDAYEKRQKHIAKLLEANNIMWHPIQYTAKPPIFSTLFDLRKMQKTADEIISNKEYNIKLLHCRSYISAHIGASCQKKYGTPWIFDMRGFWADERAEGGIWNISKPIYKLIYKYFKSVEKEFITKSNHIVSLTQNGADEIRSWQSYQTTKVPISIIPCCVDLNLFRYQEKKAKQLREKLNINEDAFVLSYLGSFGTWYMTEEMFDFFKTLHKKNPQSIFLCITPDDPDKLDSMALRKDIPRSSLRVVKANREDVPAYISVSNWSLFFIKPVYSKKASSPTKMGEILAVGVPLVCNTGVGDVDAIMHECPDGIILQNCTPTEYDAATETILSTNASNRNSLRSVSEQYYSLEKGIAQYESIYTSLT